MNLEEFQRQLRQKGEEFYRAMPWREDVRPYYVLVSELMLQQTQVVRVMEKFNAFIVAFPDEKVLARASLADILKLWQGLGYNRRAKFLHNAAQQIVLKGDFPDSFDELVKLPGVGRNTAGAILAYSFNQPAIFVETNIRTVYIHHFFYDQVDVDDKLIIELLEKTIDKENPRRFYQDLMDYGSWLKANNVRNISASKHYKKQSAIEGSLRQMRGKIIRVLTNGSSKSLASLQDDERFVPALESLVRDGLVSRHGGVIDLTK